eukprot:156410-Chlamydomonas_euryale.AAC.7
MLDSRPAFPRRLSWPMMPTDMCKHCSGCAKRKDHACPTQTHTLTEESTHPVTRADMVAGTSWGTLRHAPLIFSMYAGRVMGDPETGTLDSSML